MTAKEQHDLHNWIDQVQSKIGDFNTLAKSFHESIKLLAEADSLAKAQNDELEKRVAILETQVQDLELSVSNLSETKQDRPWRELR